MTETDVIPTSASVASTGKGIRYIGDHCYGYSGVLATAATPVTFLDFTTGSGYIVMDLQCFNHAINGAGNNIQYQVLLNDTMVIAQTNFDQNNPYNRLRLVVPPFTRFVVQVDNLSGATDDASVSVTGRVYGEE